jgi:hypothetical protein
MKWIKLFETFVYEDITITPKNTPKLNIVKKPKLNIVKKPKLDIVEKPQTDIKIRFGRSEKRNGYTVQNVIVNYGGEYITGQLPKTNLSDGNYGEGDFGGHLYLILPDNKNVAYVGNVSIPKEYRRKGIGTQIYQAIANKIGKTILDSTKFKSSDGSSTGQSEAGRNMWKKKSSFEPE